MRQEQGGFTVPLRNQTDAPNESLKLSEVDVTDALI